MPKQKWTIGASPDADVWMDHPDVSGLHCELTSNEQGYVLRDLRSTNGTTVNGNVVIDPVAVSTTDDIRLAHHVPMPWPLVATASRTITIGFAPSNDVTINDDSVSSRHAALLIDPKGQLLVVDRDSTNGTWIKGESILAALVDHHDTLTFGAAGLTVAQIFEAAGSVPSAEDETASSSDQGLAHQIPLPAMIVLSSIAVILLFLGAAFFVGRLNRADQIAKRDARSGVTQPQSTVKPAKKAVDSIGQSSVETATELKLARTARSDTSSNAEIENSTNQSQDTIDDERKQTDPTISDQDLASPVTDNRSASSNSAPESALATVTRTSDLDRNPTLDDSLFFITAYVDGTALEIATAWAATDDLLITNAHVFQSLVNLKCKMGVRHLGSGQEFKLADAGVHPEYASRRQRYWDALKISQDMTAEMHSDPELNTKQDLQRAIGQDVCAVDVAWLRLEEAELARSSGVRPLNEKFAHIQAGKTLTLVHPSQERNSVEFSDSDEPSPVRLIRLRVQDRPTSDGSFEANQWVARPSVEDPLFAEFIYSGCPVLDLKNRVIGMYSHLSHHLSWEHKPGPEHRDLNTIELTRFNAIAEIIEQHSQEKP